MSPAALLNCRVAGTNRGLAQSPASSPTLRGDPRKILPTTKAVQQALLEAEGQQCSGSEEPSGAARKADYWVDVQYLTSELH